MPYNILLIDDDKEFREEIVDFLDDYRVVEAGTGKEAMEILNNPNEIDVVIIDVMLPDSKGTEILKKIKDISPDLATIMLTGHSTKEIAIESLRGHADDYVEKPVDVRRIKDVIRKIIQAKGLDGSLSDTDIEGKIERVKRYAQKNYHKKVSLKDVATAVCLSPKYLSRLFNEATGESFTEYRLNQKSEKAKELLAQTGHNIDQIAYDLGYENTESFVRLFKKFTGYTPTEYRKLVRNGEGTEK